MSSRNPLYNLLPASNKYVSLMLIDSSAFANMNIKISAVRSLADICFLHVLYLVFLLCYTIRCFNYAICINCVTYMYIYLLSVSHLPLGLLTLHATPLYCSLA